MNRLIATFFFSGYLKPAPGTWGSLAGLLAAYPVIHWLGIWGLAIGAFALFWIGLFATQSMTAGTDNHDPSEIVIDEVVGIWITLLPVAYGASFMDIDVLRLWPGWIAAFIFFRLFDITKPWLVGWADKKDDAMGVMLDDVIAGVFAAIAVIIVAVFAHEVLM